MLDGTDVGEKTDATLTGFSGTLFCIRAASHTCPIAKNNETVDRRVPASAAVISPVAMLRYKINPPFMGLVTVRAADVGGFKRRTSRRRSRRPPIRR